MENAKHTQGKWTVDNAGKRVILGGMGHPTIIASVKRKEDAQLIAAAPDLAEALKELLDLVGRPQYGGKPIGFWKSDNAKQEAARAALAKAGLA